MTDTPRPRPDIPAGIDRKGGWPSHRKDWTIEEGRGPVPIEQAGYLPAADSQTVRLPEVEQIVRRMTKKEPWPQFGVPRGHEATARAAYNAAIASVLARLAALKEQP